MSSPASRSARLLHADEEQLDRAIIQIKSGTAFVVIVCPPDLQSATLAWLRAKIPGVALPGPVEMGDAWEMLDALIEQVGRRDQVLSLMLGRDVMSALDGLNLHREKVVKGGPVILWLDDVAALMKMRERAPDAFSFRSTMVVVSGDGGPLPMARAEEPEEVQRLRKRLKRARTPPERAGAGQHLAEELRARGRNGEAESVARNALKDVPTADTDDEHLLRVRLYYTLSAIAGSNGKEAQRLYWSTRALAEIQDISFARGIDQRALAEATFPGSYGFTDRVHAKESVHLVRNYGLEPKARLQALRSLSSIAITQGDLLLARSLLDECGSLDRYATPLDRADLLSLLGELESASGRLISAERRYRDAAAVILAEGGSPRVMLARLTECLLNRGEIEAAESIASEAVPNAQEEATTEQAWRAVNVAFSRGALDVALKEVRQGIREAEALHSDLYLLVAYAGLANIVEGVKEAERLPDTDVVTAAHELEVGQDVLLSVTGPDGPPWYPIQLLDLRARLLALTPETLPQALTLARQALDLARSTYADLLPETGRALADHLLRAGKPDEALCVIADVEPEAISRGFLKERARLLADHVLALVQRAGAPATIEPALATLREALAATDSPRITAETLRDLAKRLPPSTTTPDPLALAEEALGLFAAMPMPAEEARCLEIMGDVLLARGLVDEAKRRYLTARSRLQRYGLGLRLPLLDRKIDALA